MRIKKLKNGSEKLTKEKSRIIAHLIGDGCAFVSKHDYNIKYEVADSESLTSFEKDIVSVYGLPLLRGHKPSGKTGKLIPFVRLRSKLAYQDLLNYASFRSKDWRIKNELIHSPRDIKKEFLKSLFDDEGTVFKSGNKGIIRLYSINLGGLKQTQIMLEEFNIPTTISSGYGAKRNVYAILVKDLRLFYNQIGFNLKRKQDTLSALLAQ